MEYTDRFLLVPAEQYSALLESSQKAAVVPRERVEEPMEVDSVDDADEEKDRSVEPPPQTRSPQERGHTREAVDSGPTLQPQSRERVLEAVPKRFRAKADRLLHLIETVVRWNDKGEVVKENGTVLRGSHITDLLRDTVYPLKKVDVPGREYVRPVIRKLYIPKS